MFFYVTIYIYTYIYTKHKKASMIYGKIECRWGIKSFLSLSNITLLFPWYVTCPSTILKFLQDFLKLALFLLSVNISSGQYLFLKPMCLLLAIFPKFISNQKEKRGFIWPKTFDLLFQKHSIYNSEKRRVPWKWLFLNFLFFLSQSVYCMPSF